MHHRLPDVSLWSVVCVDWGGGCLGAYQHSVSMLAWKTQAEPARTKATTAATTLAILANVIIRTPRESQKGGGSGSDVRGDSPRAFKRRNHALAASRFSCRASMQRTANGSRSVARRIISERRATNRRPESAGNGRGSVRGGCLPNRMSMRAPWRARYQSSNSSRSS